jgi:hypothetical protein
MKKAFLSVFFLFGLAVVSMAGDPPPFNGGNPSPIPIDGGVSFLLAAGAAYGVKKVRDARKVKADGDSTEEA